jgi:hypothetical protein
MPDHSGVDSAARDRGDQAGDIARRERLDAEQLQVEHRVRHAGLDDAERDQQQRPAEQPGEDPRVRPAHRVAAVRLDPIRDRREYG